ncbi:MAG: bifunctional transaldolase/phosoglucose isomerase [Bacteroidia bacterium]
MSKLTKWLSYGQSYWLDNLSREKINSGELQKRVSKQGLRGITSNPSIFNEAISNGKEYDEQIKDLVGKGCTIKEIYDALTVKDVQDACDILEPVFKQSDGFDGFVSLEVEPGLARDTEGTIKEARRLYQAVGRKNCLIKIPGTTEGIPAIEQMLYEGININVTLLFSIERYVEVANAYLRALQRRIKEGREADHVISVASFFLSRIDTLTDQVLGQYISTSAQNRDYSHPEMYMGKAGTASAIISYQLFLEIFNSEDWKEMEAKGAQVQRLLWASTSNKDPLYDDLRYVEPLIGVDTINTLPDKTITAFEKKGILKKNTIEDGVQEAKKIIEGLNQYVDFEMLTQQLENEGVQKFMESFQKLMSDLAVKRLKIIEGAEVSQKINSVGLESDLKNIYASLDVKLAGKRLFAKDTGLWKTEKEQVQTIDEGLGWLTLPDDMLPEAEKFMSFAEEIKREGYTSTVLLGMGGSSLCSEVARETFGSATGYPQLYVLDNTEPAAIRDLENKIELEKTLFIVASKSGSTLETNCFFNYFYDQLKKKNYKEPGKNFVSITDENTSLVKLSEKYKFRKTFINAANVGGRYSVLSDFGILPMALVGIDVKAILQSAKQMMISCGPDVPAAVNPGISLGALLGLAQRKDRDKITFVLSSSLKSFGYWVEQLLAESTGKEGKGLIPVNGEILGNPEAYNNDRVFVHMYLPSDENVADQKKLTALEKAGHPVVSIRIENKTNLGGAYYQWEIATAIAGMVIGVNPFDQPNVTESKKNTNNILDEWIHEGSFKTSTPLLERGEIKIFAGKKVQELSEKHINSIGDFMDSFLNSACLHDYIALLPYFSLTSDRTKMMDAWREEMKSDLKEATTLLNGPRYLHSTGQLHKGGPDSGLYILLVGEEKEELEIPGQKYGFGTLHQAQALGDFRSLDDKERRVVLIRLGKDIDAGLKILMNSVQKKNIQFT